LRPDNCNLDEYEAWFQSDCKKVALEPGFTIVWPGISAGRDPLPPWRVDLGIIYLDQMYIRIVENYRELSRGEGGRGRLDAFSYHYGPCSDERDDEGFPPAIDDCVIRIDIDVVSNRHIHYQGEDHIPEHRILGLNFDQVCPSMFISAVEQYRQTSKPLHEILKFRVVPAK
jgi:hypothetical protein